MPDRSPLRRLSPGFARSLLLLLLPLAAVGEDGPGPGWKPGQRVAGDGFAYQVFSKASEGERFVRYQVRGTIDAEPDALVEAVRAIASDPARAPDGQTRRLLSTNDREFVTHTRIDMPPLFTDRDIVTRGVSSVDERSGARRIDWTAIDHPDAPPDEGVIRIPEAAGFWTFTGVSGTSRVAYETHLDLGGALPGWLIQGMMAATVATSFEDVAREALGR